MPSLTNKAHKERCKRYKAEGRRERNKVKKLNRHIKNQPNDEQAKKDLARIKSI